MIANSAFPTWLPKEDFAFVAKGGLVMMGSILGSFRAERLAKIEAVTHIFPIKTLKPTLMLEIALFEDLFFL